MAAGEGSRLGKLTEKLPKCLLPVSGKPMLEWWLDACFSCNEIERVSINIHHMANAVEAWLENYFVETGSQVRIIDERTKLL